MSPAAGPQPAPRLRTGTGRGVLAGLSLVLLATVGLAPRSLPGGLAALVLAVGAPVAAWTGVRVRALRRGRVPWVSLTLTFAALADLVSQGVEWATGAPAGVSIADLLRVAGYGTLAAMALQGQVGGRRQVGSARHALLDGSAALAVGLLVADRSGVAGVLTRQGFDPLDRLLWIGYPILGAVLIGLVAWRVVLGGRIRWAALLGLIGSCCWLTADIGRLVVVTSGNDSGWPRASHLAGMLLLALVPWTRSSPADQAAGRRPGHGWWRLILNVAPFTAPTALLVVSWTRGDVTSPIPELVVLGVLLVLSSVRTRLLALDAERGWAAVRSQARRSEALAVNSSDAVAVVDADGRLTADSGTLTQLVGRPATAGDALADLLAAVGVEAAAVTSILDRTLLHPGTATELELEGRTAAGEPLWLGGRAVDLLADADVGGVVVSVYDITRRKLAEQELAHQAFHDGLTGLANRSLFLDRAEQSLRRSARTGAAPVVLCLDLDGFKDVNDSLGHLAGDALLQVVATRLLTAVRSGDTVARLGGDEFAVLLDDTAGAPAEAADLAQRLVDVLGQPVDLDGHSVTVGASIGIVEAEPDATPLGLLQDGDIAMYRAKAAGRRQWVSFDPGMRAAALERIELERELGTALPQDQLSLVYQPVVDLRTERVVGFEALLRWQHPTLGAVGPDRFVPVAEASGLIVPIGSWVLAEAARTAARWQLARESAGEGALPLTMAVNVSARQLADGGFIDEVAATLTETGIPPCSLVLEVTETALVTDPETVGQRLVALQRLGVRIALDDFGTGYSSLSYLRQFPVDVLKIDRSFVSLLSGSDGDAAIVHGLIQLGRTLNLEVVAEGVERPDQRDRLRAEQCDLAQGWLFSAALTEADAERLVVGTGALAR